MKISTYRIIDIAILSGLVCLLEAVNMLTYRAFKETFTLSIMLPISMIVMARWKWFAFIPAAAAGAVYCAAIGAEGKLYLIYTFGNIFILLNLFWFKTKKGKDIFNSAVLTAAFTVTAFIAINIGRSLVSLIFYPALIQNFIKFIFTDALNLVIGLIIVLIARRQDGLMENQYDYLKRISVKNRKEKEEEF